MKDYYVYICTVDNTPRYVGKGTGDRLNHCMSGKSTSAELNRAFFSGSVMNVFKYEDNLSEDEALELEMSLIDRIGLDQLYNKKKGSSPNKIKLLIYVYNLLEEYVREVLELFVSEPYIKCNEFNERYWSIFNNLVSVVPYHHFLPMREGAEFFHKSPYIKVETCWYNFNTKELKGFGSTLGCSKCYKITLNKDPDFILKDFMKSYISLK